MSNKENNNMIQLIMKTLHNNSENALLDELKPVQKRLSQTVYQETDALERLTAVKHALDSGDEVSAQALAEQWLASVQAFSELSSGLNPMEALNNCLHQHQRQLQIVETNAHIRQVTAVVKDAISEKKKDKKRSQQALSKEARVQADPSQTGAQDLLDQIRSKD